MTAPMLRARAAHRSCRVHGDNGCENQGEAGPRTRAQERRAARRDIDQQTEGTDR